MVTHTLLCQDELGIFHCNAARKGFFVRGSKDKSGFKTDHSVHDHCSVIISENGGVESYVYSKTAFKRFHLYCHFITQVKKLNEDVDKQYMMMCDGLNQHKFRKLLMDIGGNVTFIIGSP